MNAQLLVLAKRPAPGRVKTRLCPPCSPDQAAAIAAAALEDTLDAVRAADVRRRVLAVNEPLSGTVDDLEVVLQRGDGLGERIANAFADTAAGSGEPILQIGMDTPQVNGGLLSTCAAQLVSGDFDVVLGHAADGGWWALGVLDPQHADLVRDIPMSTSDTGHLTETALKMAGLRVGILPVLRDVDTFADAIAVAKLAPHGRFAAEVTA